MAPASSLIKLTAVIDIQGISNLVDGRIQFIFSTKLHSIYTITYTGLTAATCDKESRKLV